MRLWQLELAALKQPPRQVSIESQWHASMQETIVAQFEITAECWEAQFAWPHWSQAWLSGPGVAPPWQVSDWVAAGEELELQAPMARTKHAAPIDANIAFPGMRLIRARGTERADSLQFAP
jgi:hypothetical protein